MMAASTASGVASGPSALVICCIGFGAGGMVPCLQARDGGGFGLVKEGRLMGAIFAVFDHLRRGFRPFHAAPKTRFIRPLCDDSARRWHRAVVPGPTLCILGGSFWSALSIGRSTPADRGASTIAPGLPDRICARRAQWCLKLASCLVPHRASHDLCLTMRSLGLDLRTAQALVLQVDLRAPQSTSQRVETQVADGIGDKPRLSVRKQTVVRG